MFREMFASIFEKYRLQIVAGSSILFLVAGIFLLTREPKIDISAIPENVDLPKESLTPIAEGEVLAESKPTHIRAENAYLDADIIELGLQENNEIEVPKTYTETGWYKFGPTPGELGPAVILGHVAAEVGPGVFGYLWMVKPGDLIEVDREDGTTAIFRVDKLETYPQNNFPTSLVYGDIDYAGLRLITCTGIFNEEDKTFSSNLIVYTSLVGTK